MIRKGDPRNLSAPEKERRLVRRNEMVAMLDKARSRSRTELRDGREFRVLRLPDRYSARLAPGATHLRPDEIDRLAEGE